VIADIPDHVLADAINSSEHVAKLILLQDRVVGPWPFFASNATFKSSLSFGGETPVQLVDTRAGVQVGVSFANLTASSSALSVEDTRVVQVKVTSVVQQYAASYPLTECVAETVNSSKVIKDDRATHNSSVLHNFEGCLGGSIVVCVYKAQYQGLVIQATAGLNYVANNDLNVSAIEITFYGGKVREDTIRVFVHVKRATTRRKAAEGVKANHRPIFTKFLNDAREEHGCSSLEHSEFGHYATNVEPGGIFQALIQVRERIGVTVG
jgi:hypothetical protein